MAEPSYEEFVALYKKHFIQLIAPIITKAVQDECTTKSGGVWKYISDLVVQGVERYVYAVYKPKKPFYKRRGRRGGLGDPNNVAISVTEPQISDNAISIGINIINTTVAGTIYGYSDDDSVGTYHGYASEDEGEENFHAIPGGGGYIEDQILGGTGYMFPVGRGAEGDFHQPRNFYQVYDDEYNPDYAGEIILSAINDGIVRCSQSAIMLAIQDLIE